MPHRQTSLAIGKALSALGTRNRCINAPLRPSAKGSTLETALLAKKSAYDIVLEPLGMKVQQVSAMDWESVAKSDPDKVAVAEHEGTLKFHRDSQYVCVSDARGAILLENISNVPYTVKLTEMPPDYQDHTLALKAISELPMAPVGATVHSILIPPCAFYIIGGKARTNWLHTPVWYGNKQCIRIGVNMQCWHDPLVSCKRLVAALHEASEKKLLVVQRVNY